MANRRQKPLLLPARHWLNLVALVVVSGSVASFWPPDHQSRHAAVLVMTAIALLFGIHMVMAIGGPTCRWWCPCSTAIGLGGCGDRLHAEQRPA